MWNLFVENYRPRTQLVKTRFPVVVDVSEKIKKRVCNSLTFFSISTKIVMTTLQSERKGKMNEWYGNAQNANSLVDVLCFDILEVRLIHDAEGDARPK